MYHVCLSTGVGRVVAEASTAPTVIPIWHVGEKQRERERDELWVRARQRAIMQTF